jgi:hypothetical protein
MPRAALAAGPDDVLPLEAIPQRIREVCA